MFTRLVPATAVALAMAVLATPGPAAAWFYNQPYNQRCYRDGWHYGGYGDEGPYARHGYHHFCRTALNAPDCGERWHHRGGDDGRDPS